MSDAVVEEAQPRTAIITGGARGIGAAIANRLASDGLQVAVLDLDKAGATATAAPGFIQTEMTKATAIRMGLDPEEHIRMNAESTPVGRVGQPEDIAHAVSFFVSEGASFVSGQVIYVAGGPRA